MKSLILFSVVILILYVSCDDIPAQQVTYGDHQVSQALRVQYPTQIDSTKNLEWHDENSGTENSGTSDIDMSVMHALVNSKNEQPFWFLYLPSKWKVIRRGATFQTSIEGPNGLNIITGNSQNFVYTNYEDMNRSYQASGSHVKKPIPIDSIFSELLIPAAHDLGMTLLTHYPLPEVTANNIAYTRQLSVSTPQYIQKTEGSDWTDLEGNKVFIVMYYSEIKSAEFVNWGYYLEILKAETSYFEQAKKQFVYSISNKRFSKSEIDAYSDSIAIQKQADEINHSFYDDFHKDSTGKMVRDSDRRLLDYSRISTQKIRHFGKDRTLDEIKNDSVNVILVVNPFDGKDYLVGFGYETYWINQKCQYIQSEDTLFNPNSFETQPGLWQLADIKVYKKSIDKPSFDEWQH